MSRCEDIIDIKAESEPLLEEKQEMRQMSQGFICMLFYFLPQRSEILSCKIQNNYKMCRLRFATDWRSN